MRHHGGGNFIYAFATRIGKELAVGWYYSVVTQKIEYQDGFYDEGTGMPPTSKLKIQAARWKLARTGPWRQPWSHFKVAESCFP